LCCIDVNHFNTFNHGVEERRVLPDKRVLSHPENKPLSLEKQAQNGKETRYRKHLCTRISGIPEPLQNCSETPLKVRGRLLTERGEERLPPALGRVSD